MDGQPSKRHWMPVIMLFTRSRDLGAGPVTTDTAIESDWMAMSVCQYIIEKIQSDLLSVLRRPSISFRYYMVRQSTRFHSVDGLFRREKRLSRLNYHHLLGECALPSLPQRYCPVVLFSCWAGGGKKRKEKLLQRFRAGSNNKKEVGSILVLSFVLTAKRRTPGQQLGVGPFNGLVRGRITRTNYVDV